MIRHYINDFKLENCRPDSMHARIGLEAKNFYDLSRRPNWFDESLNVSSFKIFRSIYTLNFKITYFKTQLNFYYLRPIQISETIPILMTILWNILIYNNNTNQ